MARGRRKTWFYLVPIAMLAIIVAFFYRGLDPSRDPTLVPSALLNRPMPSFDVPQLQDANARLTTEDLLGEPFLFNVWGTWCPGCLLEHGQLMEIAASGVIPIYGLNWKEEANRRTLQDARDWLDRLGDPYVLTGVDADGRVAIDWGVYGAPETYLVDAQGIVRYVYRGELTRQIWEREFLPRIRSLEQVSPAQVSPGQIGSSQIGPSQIGLLQ